MCVYGVSGPIQLDAGVMDESPFTREQMWSMLVAKGGLQEEVKSMTM